MNIKTETQKLTKNERIFISILVGWTSLHIVLVLISDGSKNCFWPFDTEPTLKADYDFSEFFIYAIVPWIIFIVYKFLNKTANEK